MARSINPNAVTEYVLESELKDPNHAVWLIKQIDGTLLATIMDEHAAFRVIGNDADVSASIHVKEQRLSLELVKFGVKGWRNLPDPDGVETTIKMNTYQVAGVGPREGLSFETLDAIAPYIEQLAAQVKLVGKFTRADQKNSNSL